MGFVFRGTRANLESGFTGFRAERCVRAKNAQVALGWSKEVHMMTGSDDLKLGVQSFQGRGDFWGSFVIDETMASFKWLFETFLKANLQKKPQTIFTDQDQAMSKALREVMLEVLDANEIKIIPDQYILVRWTKNAWSGTLLDVKEIEVEEDHKLIRTQRQRKIWPDFVDLTFKVVDSEKVFLFVAKGVKELRKQAMELLESEKDVNNVRDDSIPPMSACMSQPMSASSSLTVNASSSQPKGIKKRPGNKRTRRYKNWVDKRQSNSHRNKIPTSIKQESHELSHDLDIFVQNPVLWKLVFLAMVDLRLLSFHGDTLSDSAEALERMVRFGVFEG
ncbi:protein FAR1-RELATED SEQUENCE 5-like [Senna tora]|uniref:Protein FAR1-RELATED SEQUENCE 5-like n=1 Tax=Senna tora TaxID=362788 RepID=A0A834TPG5_9FABA|nr:protein FAR1-RELATED SEQUENCE 5-like [Senna tora]